MSRSVHERMAREDNLATPTTDVLTPAQRRYCMSQIRGKDTTPELIVRSLLHRLGFRFRLHRKDLPGRPDIVLPKIMTAVQVQGCFWHSHNCALGRPVPKTNSLFWSEKRAKTTERDKAARLRLRRMGWKVLIIWECQTGDPKKLERRLRTLLN
jgi:DNA mismatch endonuclease (patch repair protein)